jgi:hypothetical protein
VSIQRPASTSGPPVAANIERLKMIQGIIDRLARNSFALKGWTITLTGGVLSLAIARHDRAIAAIAIYVIAAMAILDAYYLATERNYRDLYTAAAQQPGDQWGLQATKTTLADIVHALSSPSILLLYGVTLVSILAVVATI